MAIIIMLSDAEVTEDTFLVISIDMIR